MAAATFQHNAAAVEEEPLAGARFESAKPEFLPNGVNRGVCRRWLQPHFKLIQSWSLSRPKARRFDLGGEPLRCCYPLVLNHRERFAHRSGGSVQHLSFD